MLTNGRLPAEGMPQPNRAQTSARLTDHAHRKPTQILHKANAHPLRRSSSPHGAS